MRNSEQANHDRRCRQHLPKGASPAASVRHTSDTPTVTIEGLTITDGLAGGTAPVYPSCGGGILNLGSLTLENVTVDGNHAVGDANIVLSGSDVFNSLGGALGGGIENFGTMHLIDSTISNNRALGADNADGSSLPFPSFPGNALGGGIGNFGTLAVTDCTFKANAAQAGNGGIGAFAAIGGGGAIVNDASLTVDGTVFRDNQALGGSNSLSPTHNGHALGDGIMSGTLLALLGERSATLTVSDSSFSGNLALGGNDNQVTDAFVPKSDAPDNGYGGGILVYQGSASISNSSLSNNQAMGGTGYGINGEGSLGVGGGIFFYNFVGGVTASVDSSTISKNDAIGGRRRSRRQRRRRTGRRHCDGRAWLSVHRCRFGHDPQHHHHQEPGPGRQGGRRGGRG
jgi:hypothetical protein